MKKLHIALLVTFFVIPSISLASIDTNLKYGSRGLGVTELQDFLIDKGFLTGQSSGNFFSLTRRAVVAYQASVGLPATGFVGPMTRTKINDDLSTVNAPAVSAEVSETGATALRTNTTSNIATPIQVNRESAQSLASGCSSVAGFSITTGSPCSPTVASIVATPATNKTMTLQNGSVVEVDANGNIVRFISPQSLVQQIQPTTIPTLEAGTNVQGLISQNTIWTAQNSPYIVTDDIVIEKNVTLTIDPGVVVKFKKGSSKSNNGYGGFEILSRGNLIAKGNPSNKIVFTSYESNPQIGSWGTIEIVSGGSINFDNVEVKYASNGIVAAVASSLVITNSVFSNNGVGIFVTGPAAISNNIIENNYSGIIYCGCAYSPRDDKTFSYQGVRKTTITHNVIRNNIGQGLINQYHGGVVIQDLFSDDFSLELSYNDIYNSGSGIKFTNATHVGQLSIKNNNIYNNSDYNIWLGGQSPDIFVPNNWWGTADVAVIDSKMYDYKANPVIPLPKIGYQPFTESKISDAGVK